MGSVSAMCSNLAGYCEQRVHLPGRGRSTLYPLTIFTFIHIITPLQFQPITLHFSPVLYFINLINIVLIFNMHGFSNEVYGINYDEDLTSVTVLVILKVKYILLFYIWCHYNYVGYPGLIYCPFLP